MSERDGAELSLIYRVFDGFDRSFGQQIEAFRETNPDVTFRLESLDVPPLHARMIAGGGCRGGDYDLFLAVTDWLPELIQDGHLRPLSDLLLTDPPPDWPDGWPSSLRDLQTDPDGTVYGLPYHDGPEVFMYRTDLFGDERERDAFRRQHGRDLAPPRTWNEFLEVARFFTRPDDDLYGCVVAAKPDGHNDVYDFLIHLWSRGGEFLDERGRPGFAGPEGEAALRYYVDLIHEHRVTQPEPWTYDSVASGEFYAGGRAAMMWNWSGFQTVADLPTSAIPGRTRSTMLPGGDGPAGRAVSLIVYWVLTIPVGCRRPDLAWSFLRHVATPAMDKVTALAGGSGVRFSTWNDPEIRRRFGYYEVLEEVHRHVRTLPRLPEWQAICGVLDRMMAEVVTGGIPVSGALRSASEAVATILADARRSG
jgi:multiple sugar transport system substrate-binding protein